MDNRAGTGQTDAAAIGDEVGPSTSARGICTFSPVATLAARGTGCRCEMARFVSGGGSANERAACNLDRRQASSRWLIQGPFKSHSTAMISTSCARLSPSAIDGRSDSSPCLKTTGLPGAATTMTDDDRPGTGGVSTGARQDLCFLGRAALACASSHDRNEIHEEMRQAPRLIRYSIEYIHVHGKDPTSNSRAEQATVRALRKSAWSQACIVRWPEPVLGRRWLVERGRQCDTDAIHAASSTKIQDTWPALSHAASCNHAFVILAAQRNDEVSLPKNKSEGQDDERGGCLSTR
ncbi:hypothetical protein CDD83_9808 [Cordyceps sp. RAO-2017]|nr:hypothetical protein CDD83_9808 [Cordyceps sp. RAO-2017]